MDCGRLANVLHLLSYPDLPQRHLKTGVITFLLICYIARIPCIHHCRVLLLKLRCETAWALHLSIRAMCAHAQVAVSYSGTWPASVPAHLLALIHKGRAVNRHHVEEQQFDSINNVKNQARTPSRQAPPGWARHSAAARVGLLLPAWLPWSPPS